MSENPMLSSMIMTILGFSDAAPTADVASRTQAKELLTKTLMRDEKIESKSEERTRQTRKPFFLFPLLFYSNGDPPPVGVTGHQLNFSQKLR
jgi:hypothetical protein